MQSKTCTTCQGTRLKKEALFFRIAGKNIAELAQMDIKTLSTWIADLPSKLTARHHTIAQEPLKEIQKRIQLLIDMGLTYLTLDRALHHLSGGEAQRIRLATQIGTQLTGVLYILDEPSIGLHQRDNAKLIHALQALRDLGNTVIVVEHDRDMILAADHIIDMGPGAGEHGGYIIAAGTPKQVLATNSPTAKYLKDMGAIPLPGQRRKGQKKLTLSHCKGHNLKDITLTLPLNTFTCLTGVSGSGKSTLIHHTLVPALQKAMGQSSKAAALAHGKLKGVAAIDKVIVIDQHPIGRTPRSNPATYTGIFTDIRTLFHSMPKAQVRGYTMGRFSFNVKGGRCETCEGSGLRTLSMDFMDSVRIPCDTCQGKRYNRETLEVHYKGASIADVLDMSITQAMVFFENHPRILRKLKTLQDVGLGYLTLGQQAPTLSGGEAQRIKLAHELVKRDTGQTLYLLNEPTTGLHFQDIDHLLKVLQRLVDKGNTVLVIEHNLDVIKVADYVIDLGPEGGKGGGQLVAQGTPEEIAKVAASHTGRFLQEVLAASTMG